MENKFPCGAHCADIGIGLGDGDESCLPERICLGLLEAFLHVSRTRDVREESDIPTS